MDNQNTEKGYTAKLMRKSAMGNALMLIIFTVFMFGCGYISKAILGNFIDEEHEYYNCLYMLISMAIQYFIGVTLAIFIYKKTPSGRETEKIGSLFRKPQQSFWWVVRWIFISIAFCYATSFITTILFMIIQALTGVQLNQTNFTADDNPLAKVINIICITFFAPFFEEILMRGGLLGNTKRYGTWSAIIPTGLFFGLLHMNYPQVPFAAVMGIFSAFLVLKTKSIIPSIAVHFIINTIGGIQSIITSGIDLTEIQSGDTSSLENDFVVYMIIILTGLMILGLIALGIILFIIEIIAFRDSFKIEPVNAEVSEGKKLLHYFSSPATIILVLFYLTMTVVNALPTDIS